MSRVIYDPSLPSNRQTLGTHVGILSGIEGSFATRPRAVDRYRALSLRDVARVPFTPDYLKSGAADNFGDVLDGLSGFGATSVVAAPTKPTHRMVVRFSGPPQRYVPLTQGQVFDAAADIEQQSGGKIRIVYTGSGGPRLRVPKLGRTGDSMTFFFESDVVLSGIVPDQAASLVSQVIEGHRRWYSAGLRVISATFEVAGDIIGGGAATLLKKVWKPAVVVAAAYVGIRYVIPMLTKRASTARRTRRR